MELGMVGLGKMGAKMASRLVRGGHRVLVHDLDRAAMAAAERAGGEAATGLEQLVDALSSPRVLWVMVPAGEPTEVTITALAALLDPGDVVVDGGNSFYRDSQRRAAELRGRGVGFVDAGTSGGVWGLEGGYSLMVGGEPEAVELVTPLLQTLAPAPDRGWGHVGPPGAGHFVKMVHNGIEYGMMQAFAEGFALLRGKKEFHLDLLQIAGIWRNGSVVRSWLLDLIERALQGNPGLEGVAPIVADSGEGRWTVAEAVEQSLSLPVITLSLMQRFGSREPDSFADKLLAALRHQFGGHALPTEPGEEKL